MDKEEDPLKQQELWSGLSSFRSNLNLPNNPWNNNNYRGYGDRASNFESIYQDVKKEKEKLEQLVKIQNELIDKLLCTIENISKAK